jgi:hypothetical protein
LLTDVTAAVGVEDHRAGGRTLAAVVRQGVGDQLGPQVVGRRPADHAAGGDVDDVGQVEPALLGRGIGDVTAVASVQGCDIRPEVPVNEVGLDGRSWVGDRCQVPAVCGVGPAGQRLASARRGGGGCLRSPPACVRHARAVRP